MNLLRPLLTLFAFPLLAGGQVNWKGSVSGNWGTPANWEGGEVPESGDLLVFPANASTKNMVNNLPSGTQLQSLNFSAPGYTLTGGRMLLNVSGTSFPVIQAGHATGTTTIDCPFEQADTTATLRTTVAGATLAFGPNGDGNLGSGILRIESRGTVIVGGTFSGNGPIDLVFGGVTRIEANQNHTGTMSVAAASTLVLNATLSGPLVVSGTLRGTGGTLTNLTLNGDLDPGEDAPGRITVGGNLVFSTGAATADAFFDLEGTVAGTGHDQIVASGGVTTNGTRIFLRSATTFRVGISFVLIDKTGFGAIGRAEPFVAPDGVPITEGREWTDGPNRFRFSYVGGTGNDFTATVVEGVPEILMPTLSQVVVAPAGPVGSGNFATLSGLFSGGPPGGSVRIEASDNLAVWRTLATLPLDGNGGALLQEIPDPLSEGAALLWFRGSLP